MIGVLVPASERAVVREFFELFKTPWEFLQSGRAYDVVLCSDVDGLDVAQAKLVLVYAGKPLACDFSEDGKPFAYEAAAEWLYKGARLPIYGASLAFSTGSPVLRNGKQEAVVVAWGHGPGCVVKRIGYSLFGEVATLLTEGQPVANAAIPTLDLHIALLREMILSSGLSLTEVPPAPYGYEFITCLTHDVDHPSMRMHKWDHTMLGFLYRALPGSLLKFFRGRMKAIDVLRNWWAALQLPLVYAGLAKDFWSQFVERYQEADGGLPATYFVLPFKHQPGLGEDGKPAPERRSSGYRASEIADTVKGIVAAGCEVGLHGIDAWTGVREARCELQEIDELTGSGSFGVRMHWLFFGKASPGILEQAGAAYDSTVGYRETVGYRAGTAQAYKPLEVERLLELPLHVMDTAMFYPDYMGLSFAEASQVVKTMIGHFAEAGGCLTINWHDRSLAPERLWCEPYLDLLQELKSHKPWFATMGQAAAWFQKRRAVRFAVDPVSGAVEVNLETTENRELPGLRVRTHMAHRTDQAALETTSPYRDELLSKVAGVQVPCSVMV
jgi:hypothetical protein